MNKTIISQLLLILLVSCSSSIDERMPLLLRADSLIKESYSDSALYLLETISFQDLKTPAFRAEYALLLTQARDKCYITHTDDSLMRIAVDYYDASDDVLSRAKSHYYLGRVYQDMENIPGTVRGFLTALPLAEKVEDYDLTCLSRGNLGHFLLQHGLLEEADSLYQLMAQMAELHNDSSRLAVALCMLGDVYIERGPEYDIVAEMYQKRALGLAEAVGNIYIERKVVNSLSSLYHHMKRFSESLMLAKRGIFLQPDTSTHYGYYSIMGNVYYEMNQHDSAVFYLVKSLSYGSYYTKENAYLKLSRIARERGQMKEALLFDDCYAAYKDSVVLLQQPVELISSLKDILHQQSVEKYEFFLYRYRYVLLFFGGVLSLVVSCFFYKRREGKRRISLLQESQKTLNLKIKQSNDDLQQNEYQIKSWKQRCAVSEGDSLSKSEMNRYLNELLEQKHIICSELTNQLEQRNAEIEQLRMVNFRDLMKTSPSYKALLALRKENDKNPDTMRKITFNEWEILVRDIDSISSDFTKRLSDKYERLLEDDIHFCCLVKLGFKYKDIALLLACTVDAVYKRSQTILSRMQIIESKIKLMEILNDF